MDLSDALRSRRTHNGPFDARPITLADQHALMRAAAYAPSHFNSQPWRFVLVESAETRTAIGRLARDAMRAIMAEGSFWKRYLRYFRFSAEESRSRGDGIYIDRLPSALRPFIRALFSETGGAVMNWLQVPSVLAREQERLVAGSPLLLAVLLTREEYRPTEQSGLYSLIGLGAAIENVWLAATERGIGVQFISTVQERPDAWARVHELLGVTDDLALVALFRLGYVPADVKRPAIDWSSPQRKPIPAYVWRERVGTPEAALPEDVTGRVEDASGHVMPDLHEEVSA